MGSFSVYNRESYISIGFSSFIVYATDTFSTIGLTYSAIFGSGMGLKTALMGAASFFFVAVLRIPLPLKSFL
jgi:hypothetical protein